MKRSYKVLDTKKCKGLNFRIIYDPDASYQWHYKIQYEFDKKKMRFKKLWSYRNHKDAINDFDCENMLKKVIWMEDSK